MTTPFDTSTAVLDAAAAGTTVPGYEQIGGLLIDLARTTAVPPGAALGSGGVAAACATMAPGRLAAVAGLVKPGLIVVSLVSLAVVVGAVLSSSSSKPAVVVTPGAPDPGISRVVPVTGPPSTDRSGAVSDGGDPFDAEESTAPGSSRPGVPQGSGDVMGATEPTPSPATLPSTAAPSAAVSSTTLPSSTLPSTTVPSATVPPATVPPATVPPATVPSSTVPSTTEPPTTTAEPLGNNGNGNGNGAGNGKGNQGNETPGSGGRGPTSD